MRFINLQNVTLVGAIFSLLFVMGASLIVNEGSFRNQECKHYAICVDEQGTGPCQEATNTNELVAFIEGRPHITFDSTESVASAWSCNLFSNSTGYTATAGDKQQINTTALTETDKILSYVGGPLMYVWAECGTNTGPGIDVTVVACN